MNRLLFKVAPSVKNVSMPVCHFSTELVAAPLFTLHSVKPVNSAIKTTSLRTESGAFNEFAQNSANNMYELCAVPKKRVSLHVRRVRREGQWNAKLKTLYKPYRICLQCGQAVLPHFVCKRNPNCATMPRV